MQRFHHRSPSSAGGSVVGGGGLTAAALLATVGVCAASPLLAWAAGDGTWYALPLFIAALATWRTAGLTAHEIGLRRTAGTLRAATLHPLLVVGGAVWLATALAGTRVADVGLGTLALQVTSMAGLTFVGTLVAEDGFFRGVLWGALERAGHSTDAILLWTSAANALWFLPLLWLEPGLGGGTPEVAVHVLNVWLLGMCWGLLRLASGSVFAVAWSHGLWNGLTYTLFGFGPSGGALDVVDPLRLDPERGWVGVAFNALAFLVLWRWWQGRRRGEAAEAGEAPAGS